MLVKITFSLFPVRELLYGLGKRNSHRILYTIRSDTVVYLLAIRHVSQNDLTFEDLF